jgi:subtilisin family serine protease
MSRIRVAVLDSGVHPSHPHVGRLAKGVMIAPHGESEDVLDRLGHGTAVAAVIHHLAPEAEIVPVKIFYDQLATNLAVIIRAVDWCLENDIQVINLSLGTTNESHRKSFEQMAARVLQSGSVVVSAYAMKEQYLMPGNLPGILGVVADTDCEPNGYSIREQEGKTVFGALPYPRDIPGVPREANLNGVSFAVARVSAYVARYWQHGASRGNWEAMLSNPDFVTALQTS